MSGPDAAHPIHLHHSLPHIPLSNAEGVAESARAGEAHSTP